MLRREKEQFQELLRTSQQSVVIKQKDSYYWKETIKFSSFYSIFILIAFYYSAEEHRMVV